MRHAHAYLPYLYTACTKFIVQLYMFLLLLLFLIWILVLIVLIYIKNIYVYATIYVLHTPAGWLANKTQLF